MKTSKEIKITIEYVASFENLNISEVLDFLRETGSAEVVDVVIVNVEKYNGDLNDLPF